MHKIKAKLLTWWSRASIPEPSLLLHIPNATISVPDTVRERALRIPASCSVRAISPHQISPEFLQPFQFYPSFSHPIATGKYFY